MTSLSLGSSNQRAQVGVVGYDALEFWGYGFSPGYDFSAAQPIAAARLDWRGLGPTLRLTASTEVFGSSEDHLRDLEVGVEFFRPFYFTTSNFVPSLTIAATRTFQRLDQRTVSVSPVTPIADLRFLASNAETSRLAVTAERGRSAEWGLRALAPPAERTVFKTYFRYQENLPLGAHWVLKPAFRASYSSRVDPENLMTFTRLVGRSTDVSGGFVTDGLDQLAVRGYPGMRFLMRGAGVGTLDLRFPLARPFQGFGVAPLYFQDFLGNVFIEHATLFRAAGTLFQLPVVGAGITSRSTWLQGVPVAVSLEVHHGFRTELGGETEAFFRLETGLPSL
jgi:hypothetical protein